MAVTDNRAGEYRPAVRGVAEVLILVVAGLWCVYWFFHAWHYWEDDAFIHLEFARNLAAGHGFAFNGHVVAGDTAPFWVVLLTAMHLLIPDWLVAGKALTIVGAGFGLSGIYAFARRMTESAYWPQEAGLFPAAVVLLVVVNPYTCYWIFSGMEPLTAAGLACYAVLAATRVRPTAGSFLLGCMLAGIAPLFRPEMLFLTVLLALPLVGQWRRIVGQARAKAGTFFAGLVLITTPLTVWSIYSLHAFGHLLPNTNAAKRAAPSDSVVQHLAYVYVLGFPLIVGGLVGGILYLALRPAAVRRSAAGALASVFGELRRQEARSLSLAGWIFVVWPAITTVFYIVNHTYVQTRYILVPAPGLMIVILAVVFRHSVRLGRAAYVGAMLAAAIISVAIARPLIAAKTITCAGMRDVALFIRDHVPANAPVAVFAIGEVAFYSQHPIIDTGGITRPGAIPYLNDPPAAMVRWAQSEGAQYWIGDPPQPNAPLICVGEARFLGWTFQTSKYLPPRPFGLWKLNSAAGATLTNAPAGNRPRPE